MADRIKRKPGLGASGIPPRIGADLLEEVFSGMNTESKLGDAITSDSPLKKEEEPQRLRQTVEELSNECEPQRPCQNSNEKPKQLVKEERKGKFFRLTPGLSKRLKLFIIETPGETESSVVEVALDSFLKEKSF